MTLYPRLGLFAVISTTLVVGFTLLLTGWSLVDFWHMLPQVAELLVWALALMACSLFFKGENNRQVVYLTVLLIAAQNYAYYHGALSDYMATRPLLKIWWASALQAAFVILLLLRVPVIYQIITLMARYRFAHAWCLRTLKRTGHTRFEGYLVWYQLLILAVYVLESLYFSYFYARYVPPGVTFLTPVMEQHQVAWLHYELVPAAIKVCNILPLAAMVITLYDDHRPRQGA